LFLAIDFDASSSSSSYFVVVGTICRAMQTAVIPTSCGSLSVTASEHSVSSSDIRARLAKNLGCITLGRSSLAEHRCVRSPWSSLTSLLALATCGSYAQRRRFRHRTAEKSLARAHRTSMRAALKGPAVGEEGFNDMEDFGTEDMDESYEEVDEESVDVDQTKKERGTPQKIAPLPAQKDGKARAGGQDRLDNGGGEAFSLVAIRIVTGRRHQIRVHTAHIGHPTVTDGRYTAKPTFLKDRKWCPRNFLHRYRLAFRDGNGKKREAMAPLPLDLQKAMTHLKPKDAESAKQFNLWKEGKGHQDWEKYEVLKPPLQTESLQRRKALQAEDSAKWVCPGCGANNSGPPPKADARAWSAPKTGHLCYKCGASRPDEVTAAAEK